MAPPSAQEELAWNRIKRACAEAVRPEGGSGVERVLAWAVEACGFERGFVVEAGHGDSSCVRASWSARDDGRDRPSRTLLRRALADPPPGLVIDVGADLLERAESVRSLALRFVYATPLPSPDATRSALLLDSRRRPALDAAALGERVEASAALVALVIAGYPPASGHRVGPGQQDGIVGRSAAIKDLLTWIDRVAASDLPVLVVGESGSGKELVSRRIHAKGSRHGGPFVALNCTALPESLMDAELFGARRGAYTGSDRDRPGLFRLAHRGTLFLDEVGDMPPALQAKLLRVLQERRFRPLGSAEEVEADVRVVAASHRDLADCVRRGTFRADLYYRLAVLHVTVPPLRDRLEDLPLLVEALAPRLGRETGRGPLRLTPEAWMRLAAHDWPGNVRELHATLARALIRAGDQPLDATHFGALTSVWGAQPEVSEPNDLERRMVVAALAGTGGNVTRAASHIGWTRQKLYRRLGVLGILRPFATAGARCDEARQVPSVAEGNTSSDSSTFQ